jgi:F-type H+-transporting ATPase subunit gamma
MSQSHALQVHIGQLEEIRAILNAMKNLAFMEIHKLSGYQIAQGLVVANIEEAALDFLSFHPELAVAESPTRHIGIIVGSERGFCGDFNKSLIENLVENNISGVIAIGSRLVNKLIDHNRPLISEIAGANSTEEVPAVLSQLIESINVLTETNNAPALNSMGIKLTTVYHDFNSGGIKQRMIFPPFRRQGRQAGRYKHPPILNLDPRDFYTKLIHHYLFAVLHDVFYSSLNAENHNRLQHLENAIKHLDDETVSLHRKLKTYRQEEITEEIEVILLNLENV